MQLNPKNDGIMSGRLALLVAILLLGATLALSDHIVVMIIGILLMGSMFAHAVELQHQCIHYSAFKQRSLNRLIGIALGLPTLTSFTAYRKSHMEHHRRLGTKADTPFFNYRSLSDPSILNIAYDLFGISHFTTSFRAIFAIGDAGISTKRQLAEGERFEYGLMGFLIAVAALGTMYLGVSPVLRLWLIPAILVAQPLHFLIELPEHVGCVQDTTDVLRNTRTIVGSRFSRWFTNGNNFHVEHHLEPAVPMQELSRVFDRLSGRHRFITTTYWQFYNGILRNLMAWEPARCLPTDQHRRTV